MKPAVDHASRIRWFVAAHVAAVLVTFQLAVSLGSGLAAEPMPPLTPPPLRTEANPQRVALAELPPSHPTPTTQED
ncbi:MAG: hypothetical protein U5L74_12055 [Ideonella sp.]|nr:hypothetical protein [Ideonella sp.]